MLGVFQCTFSTLIFYVQDGLVFFSWYPKQDFLYLLIIIEQNWFLYIPSSNYPDQTMVKFLDFSLWCAVQDLSEWVR